MSEKIAAMIEEIKGLSVLELSELVKAMEEKGIRASVIGAFTEKEFVLKDVEGNESEFLPPQTDELYKM